MENHINVILSPGAPGKNLNLSTIVIPGLPVRRSIPPVDEGGTRNPGPWTPAFAGVIPMYRDSE